MVMVEPTLNMKSFLKDLEDGVSAYNLQKKYVLTPRQYRWLMRNLNKGKYYDRKGNYSRKSTGMKYNQRTFFHEPYITIRGDTDKLIIRKDEVYFGQYDSLNIAKKVKEELIKVGWDKSKLNEIRVKLGLRPMRGYNYEHRRTCKVE